MPYDVLIVGAGPAGLSAALALGRSRKKVLVCDAGERRNAAAVHLHNFVTRDGITPQDFRRLARAELAGYPSVEYREAHLERISGQRGAFEVQLDSGSVQARRIVLCTGMIDEPPALPGYRELWGTSIVQCPYCHGWEVKDRVWGVHATSIELLEFGTMLRGWTSRLTVFTDGNYPVPPETVARLKASGIALEEARVVGLAAKDGQLAAVELEGGRSVPLEVLFARPPQRHVPIVQSLNLKLDSMGFIAVDTFQETSTRGIYAAGDLLTPGQGAVIAAASGCLAGAKLNHELTAELAVSGQLPK